MAYNTMWSLLVGEEGCTDTYVWNTSTTKTAINVRLENTTPVANVTYRFINPNGYVGVPYSIAPNDVKVFKSCFKSTASQVPINYIVNMWAENGMSPTIMTGMNTTAIRWDTSPRPNYTMAAVTADNNYTVHTNGVWGTTTYLMTVVNTRYGGGTVTARVDSDLGIGTPIPNLTETLCETTNGTTCLAPAAQTWTGVFATGATKKFIVRVTGKGTTVKLDHFYNRIMFKIHNGPNYTYELVGANGLSVATYYSGLHLNK